MVVVTGRHLLVVVAVLEEALQAVVAVLVGDLVAEEEDNALLSSLFRFLKIRLLTNNNFL
jgi:hypothetical protein